MVAESLSGGRHNENVRAVTGRAWPASYVYLTLLVMEMDGSVIEYILSRSPRAAIWV